MSGKSPTIFERFIAPIFIAGLFVLGLSFYQKAPGKKTEDLRVSFLNVGQGDSVLIKTPKENYILLDGGPDKKVLSELGGLMSPLKKEFNAIILTHPHADHLAGLNYVLDRYKVGKVYMTGVLYDSPDYQEFIQKIKDKNVLTEKFFSGKDFTIDGVDFTGLWPSEDLAGKSIKDVNLSSIAFELSYSKNSFIFLGDLSAKVQEEMTKKNTLNKVDVIKVAHHGSKTGTSQKLLQITNPKYAVISVGADNDFGHPAPSVLSLLSGQIVLRTDEKGTITFSSDGNDLNLR